MLGSKVDQFTGDCGMRLQNVDGGGRGRPPFKNKKGRLFPGSRGRVTTTLLALCGVQHAEGAAATGLNQYQSVCAVGYISERFLHVCG